MSMNAHDRVNAAPPSAPSSRFAELVARTRGVQPWRRVFHALSGIALAVVPGAVGLPRGWTAAGLAVVTVVLFAADTVRLRSPRWNEAFFASFASFASPREADHYASSSWYALGATLVHALLPPSLASAAVLVLGLADPAASVAGRIWGRRALGKGSWLGAAVFAGVAAACLVALLPAWPAAVLFAVALAVAAAEVLPLPIDDNLTIPLVTGGLLWLARSLVI
jgi:dolichol kinase